MTYAEALAVQEQVRKHDPFKRMPLNLIIQAEQADLVLKRKDQQQEISQAEDALF